MQEKILLIFTNLLIIYLSIWNIYQFINLCREMILNDIIKIGMMFFYNSTWQSYIYIYIFTTYSAIV